MAGNNATQAPKALVLGKPTLTQYRCQISYVISGQIPIEIISDLDDRFGISRGGRM